MPGHGLFALEKLQMCSQFVQEKSLEHELFEDEVQIPRQFVQDEALAHGLFKNKAQMTRQFAPDEAPEHGLFEDVKFKQFVRMKRLGKSYSHRQTSDAQPIRPGQNA